jgi:ketosteroid isomerase-like protein
MSSANEMSFRQAAERFYDALNAMFTGDLTPMKALWSHADDVTYMGPGGGFQVGWNEVLKILEGHAALKLGGKVHPEDLHMTVGEDVAVMHSVQSGELTNVAGKRQELSLRSTSVFRKEGGAWKMIGHHTDPLPYIRD